MILGVRLNIEADRFPAVSVMAARCNIQLTYTDTSFHTHKHLFAARKKLSALIYIYYTEDALLKVMDHMKYALVHLALTKQHKEL